MSNKGGQKRLSAVQRQRLKKGTLLYSVSFICLWLIILSFTPFTYHLDEIKVSMTYFFGPWLLFLFLLLITKRGLTTPPRIVVFPLLAYFGAMGRLDSHRTASCSCRIFLCVCCFYGHQRPYPQGYLYLCMDNYRDHGIWYSAIHRSFCAYKKMVFPGSAHKNL